jgi:hypothetical protein
MELEQSLVDKIECTIIDLQHALEALKEELVLRQDKWGN